jgi:ecotin
MIARHDRHKEEQPMTRPAGVISKLIIWASVAALCLPAAAAEHKELKAFPAAQEGMERIVIVLPHKERGEEGAFKVELVAGKTMSTDGVNQMRLGTAIEPRPLKGWGYTFYEVTGSGHAMSTLMAPPPGSPKVERFVAGTHLTIRYNSRLPIVIYAPKGYEVRYRIWQAPAEFEKTAGKG